MPVARTAHGTTIAFDSGFFAEIIGLEFMEAVRKMINTSHFGTAAPAAGKYGNETFIASDLSDPGGIEVEMHVDPAEVPPIDGAFETCTITFQGSPDDVYTVQAAMMGYQMSAPLGDKMTAKAKLKFSGNVTIA